MNLILARTMETRLVVLFVLGACVGSLANWAIYRLAWFPRPISPWSRPDPAAPRRTFWDRLPIIGWLGLRRESSLHGTAFWLRPMLLELLAGIGFVCLYAWEIGSAGLLPPSLPVPHEWLPILHLQFAAHVVLIALMLAASMIDIDEMIIPDEITIPGTLIGLLIAAAWPQSLLPDMTFRGSQPVLGFLNLTSPDAWPAWLDNSTWSLGLGLACWWSWCAAILPRSWYSRHGWRRAIQLCFARVMRQRTTYRILRMAVMGTLAIALVWFRAGLGWHGLLTALVGMAASGGLIWLVRIIGTAALHREAMGFGDVTLMAMIGAFLGWQPCIVVFFLAPIAGLIIGILRLILFRDKEIPYGPFLCLASLFLIIRWDAIWNYTLPIFALGWLVPLLMLGCLILMGLMLGTWRLILSAFRRDSSRKTA